MEIDNLKIEEIADVASNLTKKMESMIHYDNTPLPLYMDLLYKIRKSGPLGDLINLKETLDFGDLLVRSISSDQNNVYVVYGKKKGDNGDVYRRNLTTIPITAFQGDIDGIAEETVKTIASDTRDELLDKILYISIREFELSKKMEPLLMVGSIYETSPKENREKYIPLAEEMKSLGELKHKYETWITIIENIIDPGRDEIDYGRYDTDGISKEGENK